MSTDNNVTPIGAGRKPTSEMKRCLDEQVTLVYRAKNLVGVTLESLEEEDQDRAGALEATCEILLGIASDLTELASHGAPPQVDAE